MWFESAKSHFCFLIINAHSLPISSSTLRSFSPFVILEGVKIYSIKTKKTNQINININESDCFCKGV